MTAKLLNKFVIPRALNLKKHLEHNSLFLLGPRMTGKTTLIRETLSDALVFDLLSANDFLFLNSNPSGLEESIPTHIDTVVIDEIQKAPQLLDQVHRLIEMRSIRFVLTGSSARKLRRGGVNLLGGRAGKINLHPLLARELTNEFNLNKALRYGTLPIVYLSPEPRQALRNYVGTYLQEEIAAGGIVRNLPSFARFLDIAAHSNATIVNFANIASDAQVPRTTVQDYFELLKDTLIAIEVPAWRQSNIRKPIVRSKFYFFDIGVAQAIQSTSIRPREHRAGFAFETWLLNELQGWIDYNIRDEKIYFWKSQSGFEVDFILGNHTAIEIKAKPHVGQRDLRSLRALKEEKVFQNYVCIYIGERSLEQSDGIEILPYAVFLEQLWEGRYGA
ncbi:MAG: ATP-binding protein [Gammaproteobacteria bacterium]|nr:ATP-binding protein [Gammaproteobacteria bacterium]MYF54036.1 ATP-binding protein [Gammaproteobacteria bacterium]MYK43906.1 ATP-binding protein [Gammaproteobacteria bacterium]